jgi:hypothetical protein
LAGWARKRALGDAISGRRVAVAKVPGAYTRIAARNVNPAVHCASAQRAILIGRAATRNARNSPENNPLNFSNQLKNARSGARLPRALRSKNHRSKLRVTLLCPLITDHYSPIALF